jgi:hypothetical protein
MSDKLFCGCEFDQHTITWAVAVDGLIGICDDDERARVLAMCPDDREKHLITQSAFTALTDQLEAWARDMLKGERMTGGEFVVHIDAGTGTRGEWCDTCLTPGIFTVPLNTLGNDGVSTIGEIRRCTTCIPWEDDE